MISAAPLYNGVHSWATADCIRMCGINEDRLTPLSDVDSKTGITQELGSQDGCVSSGLFKVALIPDSCRDAQMVDEEGDVEAKNEHKKQEKKPDPTKLDCAVKLIPPETTGIRLPLKSEDDLIMLDFTLSGAPVLESTQSESIRTTARSTGKQLEAFSPSHQSLEAERPVTLKTALNPDIQLSGQPLVGIHPVVSSGFNNFTPFMSRICFSTSQVPGGQKLPLPFQSATVLAQNQPLVYIPTSSCGQSLSTLPSSLGVTSSVTLPVLPSYIQERCLSGVIAPTELHSYPFSSLGRPLTSDPKVVSMEMSNITGTMPSQLPSVASVTAAMDKPSYVGSTSSISSLPNKQCFSTHTSLPATCGSPIPLLNINSFSRATGHSDQNIDGASGSFSPLKSPPQLEREMVSPQDSNEMPLDLSSKSNRQKHTPPNQRKTPPMPILTPVHTSGKAVLSTVVSKSDCSNHHTMQSSLTNSTGTSRLASPGPFVLFPDYMTNGESRSPQVLSAAGSWVKRSTALLGTIPGTFVGVANPVPASLLIRKNADMELNNESRLLDKQETISIIDQGEQKSSSSCAKKGCRTNVEGKPIKDGSFLFGQISSITSVCTSKEWIAPTHAAAYPRCPGNGKSTSSHVLPVGWTSFHPVSLSSSASSIGQIHQNPFGPKPPSSVVECTTLPSSQHSETTIPPQRTAGDNNFEGQSRITHPHSLGCEPPSRDGNCEPLYTDHANQTVPGPKTDDHPKFAQSSFPDVAVIREGDIRDKHTDNAINTVTKAQECNYNKQEKGNSRVTHVEGFKMSCSRRLADTKPKNKVLATYLSHDQPTDKPQSSKNTLEHPLVNQDSKVKDQGVKESRHSRRKLMIEPDNFVHEVDLTKVKIEKIDEDEAYGSSTVCSRAEWTPMDNEVRITNAKGRPKIKKETYEAEIISKSKRQLAKLPTKVTHKKTKCKSKDDDEVLCKPYKRKRRKRRVNLQESCGKNQGITPSAKESGVNKLRHLRRRAVKIEPPDVEEGYIEKKHKNNFRDFIPVVLTSRTRSQSGSANSSFASMVTDCDAGMDETLSSKEERLLPKRRREKKVYGLNKYPQRKIKEEPQQEAVSFPSHNLRRLRETSQKVDAIGSFWATFDEDEEMDGHFKKRKRRRQKNRKYQNGEYLTEREEELEVAHCYRRRKGRSESRLKKKQSPVGSPSDLWLRSKQTLTTQDLQRHLIKEEPEDFEILQGLDKPSGKRKFKTKHLGANTDEDVKVKRRRLSQMSGKSPSPKKPQCTSTPCKKGRATAFGSTDSTNARLVPPEARRLIVNKNAGETLLQRAARLGYKDVVLYCLQRDSGDVNRRDNAGYTALHEACSRGWIDIMQTLLDHGANVNCSAQDGTRPIHDAAVNDSLESVWLLLSYGADPTLATYSGQTAMKLASSDPMKKYISDYLSDLKGRSESDPCICWDFYSSSVLEEKDNIADDVMLTPLENSDQEEEPEESDEFLFEFSDTPLLPCYNLQMSVSCGPSNWFLLSDVLKRLKLSSRIFQARFPHFEVISLPRKEFHRQVSTSQLLTECQELWTQDGGENLDLVRYEPELMKLLGSAVEFQAANS